MFKKSIASIALVAGLVSSAHALGLAYLTIGATSAGSIYLSLTSSMGDNLAKVQINKDLIVNSQAEARGLAVNPGPVTDGGMLKAAIATIKAEGLKNKVQLSDSQIIEVIAKAQIK